MEGPKENNDLYQTRQNELKTERNVVPQVLLIINNFSLGLFFHFTYIQIIFKLLFFKIGTSQGLTLWGKVFQMTGP